MSFNREAIALLEKAAKQFRFYERQHTAKADGIASRMREERLGQQGRDQIDQAMTKAQVNGELAEEIERFLNDL